MDVVSALVANRKSAVLRKPGQRALYNPPVATQLLAALYALSCYTALHHFRIRPATLPLQEDSLEGHRGSNH